MLKAWHKYLVAGLWLECPMLSSHRSLLWGECLQREAHVAPLPSKNSYYMTNPQKGLAQAMIMLFHAGSCVDSL